MKYSINLQNGMYDAVWWYIIALILAAASAVCFYFFMRTRKRVKSMPVRKKEKKPGAVMPVGYLKNIAITSICRIENDYRAGRIDVRETCIRVSFTVRSFLRSATGQVADCETLEELRSWNDMRLTGLMTGLYGSEFAKMPVYDAQMCINAARKLVMEWR